MDNNNNNSLYGIIKQKTIIMKYTILLLSLLSLVCCNTDELTMSIDYPLLYNSAITNFYGIQLGLGEIIDLDYHTGIANDIPICVFITMICDNQESKMEFCDEVDLKCW